MSHKIKRKDKDTINVRFKIMSAISIIIIVSGHCYHGGIELCYNWFPPYSFNIALPVFISGYFYNKKHQDNICAYIWKRTKRLLIPAYLWNIFYGLLILFLGLFGFTIGQKVSWYNMFIMPFVDGEAFQYNLGSWFVYPLFAVCVVNVLFRRLLKLIRCDNEFFVLAVYLAVGMFGINIAITNSTGITGLLRLAVRVMFFLPCYGFGQFYRGVLEKHDTLENIPYFAIIFAIQLVLLNLYEKLEYTPSSCSGFENGVVVPYISAITAIAFWLRVSKLLVPILKDSKVLYLIADNTYSIMINHLAGFMSLKFVFFAIQQLSQNTLFSDFNAVQFKSTIWYYYLPNGLTQWAFVYLAWGVFIPILISLGLKKLKLPFSKLYERLPKLSTSCGR